MRSFQIGPPIVSTFFNQINFLDRILTDISAVQVPSVRIKVEPPRISQPDSPEFCADLAGIYWLPQKTRCAHKRIVRRHPVTAGDRRMRIRRQISWPAIDIDSQDAGKKILIDPLAVVGL